MTQDWRRMTSVDIRQHGGLRVILRPKQSRVAIVSETAGELLIEYFNEMGGRFGLAVNSVARVRPRNGLQVCHHESGGNAFSAHVRAKDPHFSAAEIEEIV